ncbi:MAG: ASKHA domain-containing protein, partial [Anaerolineaceae bacterium]|nr:ASKHA domain-containing protein [Anaerolineaceae bacterium]
NAGTILGSDCGGNGRCGKCLVRIPNLSMESISSPADVELQLLGEKGLKDGFRLACQATVLNDLLIEIPDTSLLNAEVSSKGPMLLPEHMYSKEPFTHISESYGLAVDLGTTTIAVYLCDLDSEKVAGSISVRNPQAIFGDDVMSRISAVIDNSSNLTRLQNMVVKAIQWCVTSLCQSMHINETGCIKNAVVVGNSTMIHLFVGENPSSLGAFPYEPRFIEEKTFKAETVGFSFNPYAEIFTLPLISGYLGSDIVAAALATELGKSNPGTMLVDIGTNGEVMLMGKNQLLAASCATGPAFEGAAIKHGMHAVSGAIDAVKFDKETGSVICSVIQKDPHTTVQPSGMCGSGVISAVAELYRNGFLSGSGQLNSNSGSPYIRYDENGILEFELVPAQLSQTGRAITLTQKDIRAIQLAKGALITGMKLLCDKTDFKVPKRLLVAGAFGTFIDVEDAKAIGMFPDLPKNNVTGVGNAAGAGAVLSLFDPSLRAKARELAHSTIVVALATMPNFEKTFISALAFPE